MHDLPNAQGNVLNADGNFGGRLSFKNRNEQQLQAAQPVMPISPVPKCEPPRVMNDPTYSEDTSRYVIAHHRSQKVVASLHVP